MWINHKTRKFSRLFHRHKIHVVILLGLFTDRFDRFPFPFIYSQTSEIPHPLIYLKLEKGTEYSSVKMTMTNISSYYHNLKLGPVGMLEGGGTLWWNCIQLGKLNFGHEWTRGPDCLSTFISYPQILYKCEIMQSGCKVVKVPTLTTIKSKARAGWMRSKIDIQVIGVWNLIGTLRYNGGESATATRTSKQQ